MSLLQFAFSQVWAMEPGAHRKLVAVLSRHAEGIKLSDAEITAATGRDEPQTPSSMTVDKGVATIPINGVIAHRASSVGRISSNVGTSVEGIRADLQAALADPQVQSIVLSVDSPGGSVAGIDDLADEIRAAREQKPIVAFTDGMMASAAYWLASQAHQVFATKSAIVGSIGVIASFTDNHRALMDRGYDPVVVKSTPGKGGVQSNGAFSDADRADAQREVDAFHAMFLEAVAAGRGIDVQDAKRLADGRIYLGAEAASRGFVDAVASLTDAVGAARNLRPQRRSAKAVTAPSMAGAPRESERIVPPAESAVVLAERERSLRILAACGPRQGDLANALLASTLDLHTALHHIVRTRRLQSAVHDGMASTKAVDKASRHVPVESVDVAGWQREWASDAELRSEFKNELSAFIHYRRALRDGRVG